MAEHYLRLYELPGGLYTADAPVLIRSGAMLWDVRKQNILVQLKFYNLDPAFIQGLTVSLSFPECPGQELLRSYTKLCAAKDTEFGDDVALLVPYVEPRSFRVRVTEVRFADGTCWKDSGAPWEPIPKAQTLAKALGSEELAQQYRICYGTDCVYAPMVFQDLWQCTCGKINRRKNAKCRRCHRDRDAYLAIDLAALVKDCDKRLAEEKDAEDEDLPRRREPQREGWRCLAMLLFALFLVLMVIFFTPRALNAIAPLPTVPPTEEPLAYLPPSIAPPPTPTPEPTPEPTLSPEEQQLQDYREALELLEAQRYSEARAAFLKLGSFRESEKLAKEAVYRKACALLQFIRDYDEREVYGLLSMEARGTNRFSLSKEKALALGSDAVASLRSACGGDKTDVNFADEPSGTLKPLASCVRELFQLLDGYADSEACLEELEKLTDYTRDFYMLLEAGDIYGAYDWLNSYRGVFSGREHWLQLLDLYKPYCGNWVLESGDPTLLPMTTEQHEMPCYSFNSRVIISGDTATLRLLFTEGEGEYFVDLTAETGSTNFLYNLHGIFYLAAINRNNNFAYFKYYDDSMHGSVEYNRAG